MIHPVIKSFIALINTSIVIFTITTTKHAIESSFNTTSHLGQDKNHRYNFQSSLNFELNLTDEG